LWSVSSEDTGDPTAIWSWRLYKESILKCEHWERRWSCSLLKLERYTRALHKKLNLSFDILTDLHLKTAEEFRLVFTLPDYLPELYKSFGNTLDRFHDEPDYRLPIPARYVVDKQGIIRAADVNADYTVRPEPSETLRRLRILTM
jgi:peroxiredoxin